MCVREGVNFFTESVCKEGYNNPLLLLLDPKNFALDWEVTSPFAEDLKNAGNEKTLLKDGFCKNTFTSMPSITGSGMPSTLGPVIQQDDDWEN